MRLSAPVLLLAGTLTWALMQASSSYADDQKPDPKNSTASAHSEDRFSGAAALLPADVTTKHRLGTMAYTAHAGTVTLRNPSGDPTARVFYVAYTKDASAGDRRPVSFFFNGGPGAGTAYLHLGAAGPVALNMPAHSPTDGAHATLGDNPDSWLP